MLTQHGARLLKIQSRDVSPNWLFLPGGPGLGSASLQGLSDKINLPGTLWNVDFPNDGDNLLDDDSITLERWQQAVIEACQQFKEVYLIAHSFAGMLALTINQLDDLIQGLVLINSAPDQSWQKQLMFNDMDDAFYEKYDAYIQMQNNQTYREFCLECYPVFFAENEYEKGKKFLQQLSYNNRAYQWAENFFHPHFNPTWIPSVPTLIIGCHDQLTPINLFLQHKEYQRDNIKIEAIEGDSHFAWFSHLQKIEHSIKIFFDINS